MRFIHTADWHLGRTFHNVSLVEDQAHVLDQLIALVRDVGPEALVIAGDIYDRAVPPTDAVRLLEQTLQEVVLGLRVPVLLIAGNHDSPDRLGFAADLLSHQGLHIRGNLSGDVEPVVLQDEEGPVRFFLLPYAEPSLVRERLADDSLRSHDAAMAALTRRIRGGAGAGAGAQRSVLVAHCFASGGEESESERPLSVGGAGNVDTAHFAGFHYTALGHLHRPQSLGATVRYSGSLLKYSFSEVEHEKSASVVEMDAAGKVGVQEIPLVPRRDVRIVEGLLADLLRDPAAYGPVDDYLLVRLTDTSAILDAIGKLREAFPNVLHLERPGLWRSGEVAVAGRERLKESERALFASFFLEMTGEALSAEQGATFEAVVEELRRQEREVPA